MNRKKEVLIVKGRQWGRPQDKERDILVGRLTRELEEAGVVVEVVGTTDEARERLQVSRHPRTVFFLSLGMKEEAEALAKEPLDVLVVLLTGGSLAVQVIRLPKDAINTTILYEIIV